MCRALLRLFSSPSITFEQRTEMGRALAGKAPASPWPRSIDAWQQRTEKLLARALDSTPRDLLEDFRELGIVEAGAQAAWDLTERSYRDMMLAGQPENPALVSARLALGAAGVLKVTSNAALRALMDRATRELCQE